MKFWIEYKRPSVSLLLAAVALVLLATVLLRASVQQKTPNLTFAAASNSGSINSQMVPSVELLPSQLETIRISALGTGWLFPGREVGAG
jgi:hypothetical protein